MLRGPVRQEEIGQHLKHYPCVEPALYPDRQTFPRELVDDAQHAERFAVMGPVQHEVITPDMMAALRAQPNTGAVIEP